MLGRLLTGRLLFVGERSLRVDAIMLQWLLAERFKLALDREERALPGHALVVGKSGLNGKPSEPDARSRTGT